MVKAYIRGGQWIKNPVDALGNEIKAGDTLTWDFHDNFKPDEVKEWMRRKIFIVQEHSSGKGLCAKGIDKDLYLHDFRFKYCEINNNSK